MAACSNQRELPAHAFLEALGQDGANGAFKLGNGHHQLVVAGVANLRGRLHKARHIEPSLVRRAGGVQFAILGEA
ncbi:hypothetical protein D3C84_1281630 [compost metagenome]